MKGNILAEMNSTEMISNVGYWTLRPTEKKNEIINIWINIKYYFFISILSQLTNIKAAIIYSEFEFIKEENMIHQ